MSTPSGLFPGSRVREACFVAPPLLEWAFGALSNRRGRVAGGTSIGLAQPRLSAHSLLRFGPHCHPLPRCACCASGGLGPPNEEGQRDSTETCPHSGLSLAFKAEPSFAYYLKERKVTAFATVLPLPRRSRPRRNRGDSGSVTVVPTAEGPEATERPQLGFRSPQMSVDAATPDAEGQVIFHRRAGGSVAVSAGAGGRQTGSKKLRTQA